MSFSEKAMLQYFRVFGSVRPTVLQTSSLLSASWTQISSFQHNIFCIAASFARQISFSHRGSHKRNFLSHFSHIASLLRLRDYYNVRYGYIRSSWNLSGSAHLIFETTNAARAAAEASAGPADCTVDILVRFGRTPGLRYGKSSGW